MQIGLPQKGTAMTPEEMKLRTKQYALRIIKLADTLKGRSAWRIADQLLRSGTSVGANYRAACRARSHPDFISKLGICEEEADESLYWMELLADSGKVKASQLSALLAEGNELLAIICASRITALNRARK